MDRQEQARRQGEELEPIRGLAGGRPDGRSEAGDAHSGAHHLKVSGAGSVGAAAEVTRTSEFLIPAVDTGVALAPETIPSASEPFGPIDRGLNRGTCLGLSLVKSLFDRHNGRLEIESALNQGTTVRVFFPSVRICASEGALRA